MARQEHLSLRSGDSGDLHEWVARKDRQAAVQACERLANASQAIKDLFGVAGGGHASNELDIELDVRLEELRIASAAAGRLAIPPLWAEALVPDDEAMTA